jgi:hypothetical protein
MVPIPDEADQDARRCVRERTELLSDRVGLTNRIGAVLATLGVGDLSSASSKSNPGFAMFSGYLDADTKPPSRRPLYARCPGHSKRLIFTTSWDSRLGPYRCSRGAVEQVCSARAAPMVPTRQP